MNRVCDFRSKPVPIPKERKLSPSESIDFRCMKAMVISMKLWGKVILGNKIQRDVVIDYPDMLPSMITDWDEAIGDVCQALDLSRPVVLLKNIADLQAFYHTTFKAGDFTEHINFDKLMISVLI